MDIKIQRDHHVGLGMNVRSSTHGPNNDQECLEVNALLSRQDGSPGPAEQAGVQVGDLVVIANGFSITDFPSLKQAVRNSKTIALQFERKGKGTTKLQKKKKHIYEGHYPEIVLLRVTRDSPTEKMGVVLHEVHEHRHSSYFDDEEETQLIVERVKPGPFSDAGVRPHDVLLSINNHHVSTNKQVASLVRGKTDLECVVKRMSQSQNARGRRENKLYTFNITVCDELNLGLDLKGIKSGLGDKSSDSFLYVKELREYPNGDPGPGLIAGVRPYDLVLKINDVEIHTVADVKRATEGQEMVECKVRRMIRELHTEKFREITSEYAPDSPGRIYEETLVVTRAANESLGLSLTEAYGGGSSDPIVIVTKVRSGGAGERCGFKVHDVISRVQQKEVSHVHDIQEIVHGLNTFEVTVRRESLKTK